VILAAGLSPAWQQMLIFDGVRVGEVNRAREAHWCSSGKVLNVGLALHHLGGPHLTLAPVGGVSGECIEGEFAALGIQHRFVRSNKATRVCTTILDRGAGRTTELVENASPAEPGELEEFFRAYEQVVPQASLVVLSGSLPTGTPPTFYRDLMERTRGQVILDVRGPELLATLALRPFCVKPNREELGKTFDRDLSSDSDLARAIEEVLRLGAEWVVVSQGEGELWASGGGAIHRFIPPTVEAVNPIGCGDCLAAGIAWAVEQGSEMLEAIRFGMAAAAENAATLLPSRLDLQRVRERMAEVEVK